MADEKPKTERFQVRAENPSGACGNIDHMTIDELRERAVGESFDGSCPACGMFHLTRADIDALMKEKISQTDYYAEIVKKAEHS